MKFLLLEDENLLRKNIATYLRKKGFEIIEFDDGKTLLEKADIADFDAFILDINVPNFNGLEILEFIRNSDSKTPVVLISSYTDTKDVLNGFKLGCANYIKKPFDLEELEVRLLRAIDTQGGSRLKINNRYSYCFASRELYDGENLIKLPKTPSKLFYIISKRRGGIVKSEEILEYLYPEGNHAVGAVIGRIRDLRAFIEPDLIENVHGVGYRLNINNN